MFGFFEFIMTAILVITVGILILCPILLPLVLFLDVRDQINKYR